MGRSTRISTQPIPGQLEQLAHSMLLGASSISPSVLAARANIEWSIAQNVLQAMVRNGDARALRSGRFAKPIGSG
jgi:hypothetical protein